MGLLRPRSILQLVLIGFAIASVPLLAAFLYTASLVNDLSRSGRQGILSAAEVAQESKLLVEQSDAIERHARQYLVLDDPAVLDIYQERRANLHRAAQALRKLSLSDTQRHLLDELELRENELFRYLKASHPDKSRDGPIQQLFVDINTLARGILSESGELIGRNVTRLNERADRVHSVLFWEIVALVPAVLSLGVLVVLSIMRPLRSLSAAIERMGGGDFDRPVQVCGPRDLQHLGERLEWMRRHLLELENQKSLFLRNISHELKTPLTTLREGAQLLQEEVAGTLNDDQRDIVQLLGENARHLQRMIEDLLQFSACQTAPLPLDRQPLQLADLLIQAVDEQRLCAQAKGVSVHTELTPLLAAVDGAKIKAVLGNLISNAIKFSPSNATVHVRLQKQPDWAVVDVVDQGRGIDRDDRQRVFEAFYQARQPAEGWIKGSGLGLFIAREFVQMHQGTIDVLESAQGAHLQVRLPLSTALAATDGVPLEGTVVEYPVDRQQRLPNAATDRGRASGRNTLPLGEG